MQKEKHLIPETYGLAEEMNYEGIKVCRPLLSYTKKDLENICKDADIKYYIDCTNNDITLARNYIRHEILAKMSEEEKEDLLTYKRKDGRGFYTRGVYKKPYSIPVYDKLIIYVKEDGTRSINCGQSDIPDILYRLKKDKKTILKYQWNGRTYQSNEIPFWKPKVHSGASISVRSYSV